MDTANHWRRVRTDDAGGGFSSAWTLLGTLSMESTNASATERRTAAQEGVEVSHTVNVSLAEDVVRGDRLVVGDITYEVVGVEPATVATVRRLKAKVEPWDEPTD